MATQTYQSEAELENQLIMQLNEQNYASVGIKDYDALLANFREQFCKFNDSKLSGKSLSDKEWERLTNYMLGNSVFESAKILRDKYVLERDDGTKVYVMNRFGNKNEAISFYNSEITFSSLSFVWGQSAYEVPVGAVKSLTIEGNSEINLEKGKSIDLVASLIPEDPANSEIIWSSSNEEAVTVDENGKITAVNDQKAGGDNAIITATSASNPSVKASVKVNVTNVTAIGTVNTAKTVKTVRYYNVAGVESNVPFSGMNIIVKTYSDGSRETTKAVK